MKVTYRKLHTVEICKIRTEIRINCPTTEKHCKLQSKGLKCGNKMLNGGKKVLKG